jgi:hypothetical protein
MTESIVIDARFRGPPESANGGYACGMLARFIDAPAEVTLRAAPPLGQPLRVERRGSDVMLFAADTTVAEASTTVVDDEVPSAVTLAVARRASSRYPWLERHPYPTCFVCGPQRDEHDGLRIFPGPVDRESLYAAPWVPDESLADDRGSVRREFIWAALDCPSGIVTDLLGEVGLLLLGRLAVDIKQAPVPGVAYVVQAWPVGREGRKLRTGSALFSADGELCAAARAVWIELRAQTVAP